MSTTSETFVEPAAPDWNASAMVFCYDDWEVFLAAQRGQPYRQYAVGPTGLNVGLSHGEVNWRQNVEMPDTGMRVSVDTSGDRWVTRLSWPLKKIVAGGSQPGDTLYLNVCRVTNPELEADPGFGIYTWVSHCTVKDVDRLARIRLAP